jgi:hypothetical protein
VNFINDHIGEFFFKKREILEFAINNEESSDIKNG